jgi:hypothetical protein
MKYQNEDGHVIHIKAYAAAGKRVTFVNDNKVVNNKKVKKINKVIQIGEDYMLYHVQNFYQPEDYPEELANMYDINYRDKKNGMTPFLYALYGKTKYRETCSFYPMIWLISHGVDINNFSKDIDAYCFRRTVDLKVKFLYENYPNLLLKDKNQGGETCRIVRGFPQT